MARLDDQPLVLSFKQCLQVLPLQTQVQLVEALEAANVEPSSPAWLLFSVVAELIKELEQLRGSLTAAIRSEAQLAAQDVRASLRQLAAAIAAQEVERNARVLKRYRRFDRLVVAGGLAAVLLALVTMLLARVFCHA